MQLSVGPRESDGYHQLVTVFQAISIFDDVTIKIGEQGSGVHLTVSGDQIHGVPTDSSNLVVKAVELIAEKFELDIDVSIDIKKSIPVAGGMAGGSADAAAAIVAIDELYSLDMTREEMHSIASKLGSDVPFLLSGGTAIDKAEAINSQLLYRAALITGYWRFLALGSQLLRFMASAIDYDKD